MDGGGAGIGTRLVWFTGCLRADWGVCQWPVATPESWALATKNTERVEVMKTTSLGGVVKEADSVLSQAETAIAQGEIGDIDALRKWASLACRRLERQIRKRIESGETTPEDAVTRVAEVIQELASWFEQFKEDVTGQPPNSDVPGQKPK
jgi:hypothetical protein